MKCYVPFYFHAVLLMSFHGWNTDWAITWGMRCSVMFILIKISSTKEGVIAFTCAPLCTSLRRVTAQTQEPELIVAALVMLVLGLYQHVSEPSQKRLTKALYSDLSCHIKDCQNAIYLNFLKKYIYTVLVRYTCVPNRKTRTETVRYEYEYRYTPTWGWVNHEVSFIFGWTIPLRHFIQTAIKCISTKWTQEKCLWDWNSCFVLSRH